jgi:glycerol-3-phosphate acyltransferase PlsY
MTPAPFDFVLIILAYLLGSLPFGVWVGYLFLRRDIRSGGSGHSGATNTLRQAGWAAGALVMALDIAKGFAAAWLAARWGSGPLVVALAGAAAVAGHCWPAFASFRGGMGLGVGGGAMLAVYPLGFVLGLGLAALGTLVLRHSARGNFAAALLLGPAVWLFSRSMDVTMLAIVIGAVIAMRALSDWRRVYRELWLDREKKT